VTRLGSIGGRVVSTRVSPQTVLQRKSGIVSDDVCADPAAAFAESFDQGDSTTIGPDLTWEKLDTSDAGMDVGADDGETNGGEFGVYGGSGSAAPGPGNSYTVHGKAFARTDEEVGDCGYMFAEVAISAIDPLGGNPTHNAFPWFVILGVNLSDDTQALPSGGQDGIASDGLGGPGIIQWVGIYLVLFFNAGSGLDGFGIYELTSSGGFVATNAEDPSPFAITAAPGDVFRLEHSTNELSKLNAYYNGVRFGFGSPQLSADNYETRTRGGLGMFVRSITGFDVRREYRVDNFAIGPPP
jgi:hypothetical protein